MMSNISCKPHITSNLIMLSLCVIAVVTLKMLKINITMINYKKQLYLNLFEEVW